VTGSAELDPVDTGQRIARARRRAGLTQRDLAQRLSRSVGWVQKIEQGTRRPDRWSVLHQLADALGVEVVEITGQPYRHEKADLDSGHAAVPELRLALQHALIPASAPDRDIRPSYELEADVLRAEQLRQAARFNVLGGFLPPLLDDLTAAVRESRDSVRPPLEALMVRACHIARVSSSLLGHHDLAWMAAQRQQAAAIEAGDPLSRGAADWDLIGVWLHTGALEEARAHGQAAVEVLAPHVNGDRELYALWGALHLRIAIAASRLWDRRTAEHHLAQARDIAGQTGDVNVAQSMFGPVNAAIHGAEIALELGDPRAVLERAEGLEHDVAALPSIERQSHYWTTRAHGEAMSRHDGQALKALMRADHLAPEHVRNRPLTRELVADLLDRARRKIPHELRTLAIRMGV
jgi:transcriptional regulator with XRE-family HTH domain